MKVQEFSRDRARQTLDRWKEHRDTAILSPEYQAVRSDLLGLYGQAKAESAHNERKEYTLDVLFGIKLYGYLSGQAWFNLRVAADDGFWRHLSTAVIPDAVFDRWGDRDNYFWKQSNRLWPKTAWWYVHLSWHEDTASTQEMLLSRNFNSDILQGIVERTGKKGTFVEVYREIVFQYSRLDYDILVRFKKQLASGSDSLFRAVMKLNTARSLVTDPCLCTGGVEGYVTALFTDLTIKL